MKGKKAFALRIDEEIFKEVEKLAKEKYRSTNGQIEWMLSKHLRDLGRFYKEENREE